ncbi:MAG: dicarboxylate/amino acid:cation symporter [Bacteroidota bacterium]|nr:dicarboxylate/amino acid:cation symporter [Bacteroidota bacterium]
MAKLKRIPLYAWILIALLLGIAFGFISIFLGINQFTINWITPFGDVFIRLLKLIAIPLIFVSLVKGISDLGDISKLSGMGLRTFLLYIASTVIAISIGLFIVNTIKPGAIFPEEKKAEYAESFQAEVIEKSLSAQEIEGEGPLQFLVDIVPENIIGAAGNNINMLQVIFFALLFGIALIMLKGKNVKLVISFFDGLNDVVLKIIDIIMRFAPIGVFALMASVIVDVAGENPANSVQLFASLGLYTLSVVIGLLVMIIFVYPIFVILLAKIPYLKFLRGVLPAQLLAFSTSSSAATLPMTKKSCEQNLGIKSEVTNFVLPIGATINMDGTSLYQAVAAVFIAQTLGIQLDISAQLTIILTATLASIGSAAVPGAGMVMLIVVLEAVGLPAESVALVYAVDRPLDMLRTAVNVTGDSAVSSIVDRKSNEIEK